MPITAEISFYPEVTCMLKFQHDWLFPNSDKCLPAFMLRDLSLSTMSHQTFEEFHHCQPGTINNTEWVQLWSYTSCNSVLAQIEMCTGMMAELYYRMYRATASKEGEKSPKDVLEANCLHNDSAPAWEETKTANRSSSGVAIRNRTRVMPCLKEIEEKCSHSWADCEPLQYGNIKILT